MSFKVDFWIRGEKASTSNKIRFATRDKAIKGGNVVFGRFKEFIKYHIKETNDPVNFQMLST